MKLKAKVEELLIKKSFDDIFLLVKRPTKLIRFLMGTLYSDKLELRYAAAYTIGLCTERIYNKDQEKVKDILKKLLWSLNDESGFVCWGAPLAIGEIVRNIPDLHTTYAQFLISFLSHPQVILNNKDLEKGTMIALAQLGNLEDHLKEQLTPILHEYLENDDEELIELTLWCGLVNDLMSIKKKADNYPDKTMCINIYEDGKKIAKSLSDFI